MLRSSVRNLAAAARSGIPTVARARNMVIAPRVASASSFGKGRDEYESVLDRFRYVISQIPSHERGLCLAGGRILP